MFCSLLEAAAIAATIRSPWPQNASKERTVLHRPAPGKQSEPSFRGSRRASIGRQVRCSRDQNFEEQFRAPATVLANAPADKACLHRRTTLPKKYERQRVQACSTRNVSTRPGVDSGHHTRHQLPRARSRPREKTPDRTGHRNLFATATETRFGKPNDIPPCKFDRDHGLHAEEFPAGHLPAFAATSREHPEFRRLSHHPKQESDNPSRVIPAYSSTRARPRRHNFPRCRRA